MSNAKRRHRRRYRRGVVFMTTTMFDGRGLVIYRHRRWLGLTWRVRGWHIPAR